MITHDDFRSLVIAKITECGGNRKFAEKYGFHPVEVSDWKCGRAACTPMLAAAMGYRRVWAFEPAETNQERTGRLRDPRTTKGPMDTLS